MARLRRRFTQAEKLEIVQQSLEPDIRISDLSEQFGIHVNTIYKWRGKYLRDHGAPSPGQDTPKMSDSEREIARLKKQLREAQLERDILKKAISIFSKKDGTSTNS